MTRQLTPFKLPISGITIMVIPVSMTAETMLARKQYPPPKAPLVPIKYDDETRYERNKANPLYKEAYKIYENELQIEAAERVIRKIALRQTLTDEDKEEVRQLREDLDGLEDLPKNNKILWMMKIAIMSDRDMKAILEKSSKLADPQEGAIEEEIAGF